MKYYKGVQPFDQPSMGGEYIKENGTGGEVWNFLPTMDDSGTEVCYGFVEPKHNRGVVNTLHIENITGRDSDMYEDYIDDVLVIWCATKEKNQQTVVGWYKHATFYRNIQEYMVDGEYYVYNSIAVADNCVLLPRNERDRAKWSAPVSTADGYGFGSAMVYYPLEDYDKRKVKEILKSIEEYTGQNWLRVANKEQEPEPEKKYFWQK